MALNIETYHEEIERAFVENYERIRQNENPITTASGNVCINIRSRLVCR
jgi:hypothetical protein